jgi:hypothetical protein
VDIGASDELWQVARERMKLLQTEGVESARRGMGFKSAVASEQIMESQRLALEAQFPAQKSPAADLFAAQQGAAERETRIANAVEKMAAKADNPLPTEAKLLMTVVLESDTGTKATVKGSPTVATRKQGDVKVSLGTAAARAGAAI